MSDLVISFVLYKVVLNLTGSFKKSVIVMSLYLFNPVTVFLSAVWGQVEASVALFGILAFVLLYYKKVYLSIPAMFLCLYLKPTWAHLIPFYIYLVFSLKPKVRPLLLGGLVAFLLFIFITWPFSGSGLFVFLKDIVVDNMLPGAKGSSKLSISAFNFYTIFWEIDRVFTNIASTVFSLLSYVFFNIVSMIYFYRAKEKLPAILTGIFVIAFGSFFFMENMLERYFFPAFLPLVILAVIDSRQTVRLVVINIILFLMLFYSFYRRFYDEIAHPFTDNNFLLIRVLSVFAVGAFLSLTREIVVQFKRERTGTRAP